MKDVIIIGAGIGGLSAAAALAQRGARVTVLESQTYAGGCAGTFLHRGVRFDAGATVAGGFYAGGAMDLLARASGLGDWQAFTGQDSQELMQVHLPNGAQLLRTSTEAQDSHALQVLGAGAQDFWRWQEQTARAVWELAMRNPPFPPQTPREWGELLQVGSYWLAEAPARAGQLPALARAALSPLQDYLGGLSREMRWFLDGQLLISAQTTSQSANALYAAAALDLPRRGIRHLQGGMGAIAAQLVGAIQNNGGEVLFRHPVGRIILQNGRAHAVEVSGRNSGIINAGQIIANLTPWNMRTLLGQAAPARLRALPAQPTGWGAFVTHLALERSALPADTPLHSQILSEALMRGAKLGEGNSAFVSLSPAWDDSRAPQGVCAVSISTHTALANWQMPRPDRQSYLAKKADLQEKLLQLCERAFPHLREAIIFGFSGTPSTYERYTGRQSGFVGGFPQTSLFRQFPSQVLPGLWLVGDSIFPGQSTAAVAMGGLRVAQALGGW